MDSAVILRGARVIDPCSGVDEVRDVAFADGVFVDPASVPGASVIDLAGLVVAPGFIDLHVHLRDPGATDDECIASGTRAAAAGGFTTVVAMPNTVPAVDNPAVLTEILSRVEQDAAVRVLQAASLTVSRAGTKLTDAGALRAAGAVALTDDGSCIQDNALMFSAMQAAARAGIPVVDHCEDTGISAGGVMHPGQCAGELGVATQSAACEELIVARDCILAGEAEWPVHLQHLSSGGSVLLVREAKSRGVPVTAETTPHHLFLTDQACRKYGTNAKMNPPLRGESDRAALIASLQDGTISVIATDHAPHSSREKSNPFAQAPFGIVGLEAAVGVCLTELYHTGILSLPELIAKFTAGPRQALALQCGTLQPGTPADITVLDTEHEWELDVSTWNSRSQNCPYDGWKCTGQVAATLVGGQWVYAENSRREQLSALFPASPPRAGGVD